MTFIVHVIIRSKSRSFPTVLRGAQMFFKRTAPKEVSKKYVAKIVMVGSAGVGKTSILLRHDGQGFVTKISPTVGGSFITSRTKCEDREVELMIWDTAGQERFQSLVPLYLRNAVAAVLVFDLTNRSSFHDLSFWMEEVRRQTLGQEIPFFVLANKCDLTEDIAVTEHEINAFCEKFSVPFHFTSALSGKGIRTGIVAIAKALIARDDKAKACLEAKREAEALKLEKESQSSSSVKKLGGCCLIS
uniref:GTP-binding protein n=1 Tax=Steinernema glaseri TaxID=37863 RepID=A0A1I8A2N0_9BILA